MTRSRSDGKLCSLIVSGCLTAMACAGLPSCHARPKETPAPEPAIGYLAGKWRVLPIDTMNQVALWVSHIVIAHRHSNPNATRLRAEGWMPDPPPPDRSEGEALMLAMRVADEAAQHPERFEELARKHSDDVVSREAGGSLGGVRAGQLPPQFVDALAVLEPGQVSRVVQTSFGYHIIKRRGLPPAMRVSGRRIGVRYLHTYNGRELDDKVTRTREDALALARQISSEARAGASFEGLVTRYSELIDKNEGGYIGTWSVRDPEYMPVAVECLAKLQAGEVSEPVETFRGFEILQRLEPREDLAFAMTSIQLPFDPAAAPGTPNSETVVLAEAKRVIGRVRTDPSEFDRVREQTCCRLPLRWTDGRGPAGLTAPLRGVALGAVVPEPVLGEQAYIIARRVDPAAVPESSPPTYEVPAPKGVELDAVVQASTPAALAMNARLLKEEASKNFPLDRSRGKELARILDGLAAAFEAPGSDATVRLNRWHAALDDVRKLLGGSDYARFDAFLSKWATNKAVAQPY